MQFFPNSKIFVSFGTLHITWYAICILTGALIAYALCQRTIKKWGYASALLEDYLFPLLLIGILGARIYYVIFEWSYYSQHVEEIVAIWHGGLAIHGGIIAGLLFSLYYFHNHHVSFLRMFDLIMPNVLLAQAFGRWGNFANQEAYGQIVSASYYKFFPSFIKNQMFIDGYYRQPTFLYESCLNLLGFLLISTIGRKKLYRHRGDCGFMYCIWYGITRFIVEGMRSDSLMIGSFRIAQIISVIAILIGLIGLKGVFHRIFGWYHKPVILLDVDGTISSSKACVAQIWTDIFQKYRPDDVLTQDQKDSFSGPTVEETIKQYFPNEDGKKIHEMYDALYEKYASQMVLAIPGVEDTIQHLHDDGYLIGVVSNKTTNLIEIDLNLIGIDSCIDCVIGAENMPKPKPSSSGLVAACDALNVGHDDLVYVGDTCQDIQAARNMAAYSIAFSAYSSEKKELLVYDPCRLIHSFSELQDIVQESRAWCDTRIW